jgi:PKD repeat protein/plastocyanin
VTTHELDPAQPGEGGTYNGPVGVTLSATDPDEPGGGGPPETHDVNAQPSTWSPDELQVPSGDVVRWNFPQSASAPHDVWVLEPGDAPNADGRQVSGGLKFPGDPPVSETLDEVGTWKWVCRVHSSRASGAWEGMVGTAEVSAPGGTPGSGVDFTEYRLTTDGTAGEWVRSDNDAGDDPFETSFTVSGEGDHLVEYRSTDNAGNQEAIKSVDFSIAAEDPDAPSVQGFADPASGEAPLLVQFSATGLDPQGGELTYEWDFGDGSGSFNQSPQHTYRQPGTYTATVIGTDPQGKTGSATLEIVVEDGNQAPVVRAVSDPASGDAPLKVSFSAQATDDAPAGELTYLWDFGDDGATAFGRNAEHTYREPGTYTATVTATDRGGKAGTAEVTVVVGDPSGPPTVQAAASPRSGAAPLEVRFTSVSSDPEGHAVSTVWDFGDGQRAGGPNITHIYRTPGTYTATVTVTDPDGLTDTASLQITVSGSTSSSAPPAAVAPQTTAPPPSQGDVAEEQATRPLVRAPKSRTAQSVVERGLRLRVTCTEACQAKSVLRLSGERIGASKSTRIEAGGTRTVVVRLKRIVRRNLIAAMRKAGLRRIIATAITTIRTDDVTRAFPVKVRLQR